MPPTLGVMEMDMQSRNDEKPLKQLHNSNECRHGYCMARDTVWSGELQGTMPAGRQLGPPGVSAELPGGSRSMNLA